MEKEDGKRDTSSGSTTELPYKSKSKRINHLQWKAVGNTKKSMILAKKQKEKASTQADKVASGKTVKTD
jgi:hypothetical protein